MRPERAGLVAADVGDAAEEIALAERHAATAERLRDAEFGVEPQHEGPEVLIAPYEAAVAHQLVLGAREPARILGVRRRVVATRRQQAVVAGIVRERAADRRRPAA